MGLAVEYCGVYGTCSALLVHGMEDIVVRIACCLLHCLLKFQHLSVHVVEVDLQIDLYLLGS
eukprot:14985256-Ditylum_brightwellii.AAC.1